MNSTTYTAWVAEVWRLNDLRNKSVKENKPIIHKNVIVNFEEDKK